MVHPGARIGAGERLTADHAEAWRMLRVSSCLMRLSIAQATTFYLRPCQLLLHAPDPGIFRRHATRRVASRGSGHSTIRLAVITPVTQHRRLNTQLSRHLRQWSTTRCQQWHCLPFELVRKWSPDLRRHERPTANYCSHGCQLALRCAASLQIGRVASATSPVEQHRDFEIRVEVRAKVQQPFRVTLC